MMCQTTVWVPLTLEGHNLPGLKVGGASTPGSLVILIFTYCLSSIRFYRSFFTAADLETSWFQHWFHDQEEF